MTDSSKYVVEAIREPDRHRHLRLRRNVSMIQSWRGDSEKCTKSAP